MSWFEESGIGDVFNNQGVVDIFKAYSQFETAKLANKNSATINDLSGQVSLLTMQRDMMNGYMQNILQTRTAQVNGSLGGISQYLPLLLVVGVAGFALYAITNSK